MRIDVIEKALLNFKTPQEFFEWSRPMLNGWTIALMSKNGKDAASFFVRMQLQSAPPESDDTGDIHCVTGKSVADCFWNALQFTERNPR